MHIGIRPSRQHRNYWTVAVDGTIWGTTSSLSAILSLAVEATRMAAQNGEDVTVHIHQEPSDV
jgi:hypothetical protein